jgi:eukaryotic-like serine/threonine-protein kinase
MKPLSQNTMVQGRYLIVHMIGKGGMGEVYLAVDQRLGSAVALKRTVFTDDETLRAAFEREAKILGRLRHPVLPKVSDHFSENGDQFLVMEHIAGDDLSKRLEASGKPFPLSWVMFWADQLLDALAYLHSHEPPIIHRDIKPQNLKLTDDNHIVLLDFGLSKDSVAVASDQPMISASVVGYTPHFASMEQIRGTGTTARSDIYSFAATFYQLMTNVIPMDALARADALLSGAADPLIPLHEANPEIPKDISDVMLKGIEISQDKRFGTAAEMQKELRRAFKRTQDAMSAKTVAFANPNDPTVLADESHVTAAPSEMETVIRPAAADAEMAETVLQPAPDTHAGPKQADVKTAVLPANALTEAAHDAQTEALGEPAGAEAPPPAAATPPTAQPPSAPIAQAAAASARTEPRKSKAGMIAGVLGALLVLVAIVAGGGWYAYSKYYAAAIPVASPTPAPAASPSPEPTVETAEVPSEDANANTADESEPGASDPASPGKQPVATKSAPTRQQAKPAPKTKPKDERTVILQ